MDNVYRERAHLVAFLATAYPAFLATAYPAVIGTDPAEPDWPVVYISTPEGQLSWHISQNDLDLFGHVLRSERVTWDGHTTEEKYARLDRLTRARGAP